MEGNEYYLTTAVNLMDINNNNNIIINNNLTQLITQQIIKTNHNTVNSTSSGGGGTSVGNTSELNVSVATNSSTTAIRATDIQLDWQEFLLLTLFGLVIIITLVGNTLVIVAVITTRRLRTVTNCFVTSLAIADWLVGIFVMPPAVALHLMGRWELGAILCDVWISLDVLLCTASILSLCAISVDRYLAVTQPLNYSRRRRSKRLALLMILIVWLLAIAITCPPILGWYEPGRHAGKTCRYNQNEGYVVFSAMGSFFLPMIVMLYVYVRISCVIAQRHDQLANIEIRPCTRKQKLLIREESDVDRGCSECDETKMGNRCSSSASSDNTTAPTTAVTSLNQQTNTTTTYVNSGQQSRLVRGSNHSTTAYSFHSTGSATGAPANSTSLDHHAHHHHHAQIKTPQRVGSVYGNAMNVVTLKSSHIINRSRPESLNLDSTNSVLTTYEPANRVSSFRRETKTAQTLSIVVGGFIACWLPFFIYYLITPFLPPGAFSGVLMTFLTWLGWINSAINPFIYAFYSPDFRLAFWRLTFKHCSNNHRTSNFAFHNK